MNRGSARFVSLFERSASQVRARLNTKGVAEDLPVPQLPRAASNGGRKDELGLQKAYIQVWIADSSIEPSKSLPLKALIVWITAFTL